MGWSTFRPTGLTHHQAARSQKGYTLVTPMGGGDAYLLDIDGLVVHRWHFTEIKPWYARLLDNGNLLMMGNDPALPALGPRKPTDPPLPMPLRMRSLGGNASLLHEVTWDGEVVWSYVNEAIHHDFVRRPNGGTVMAEWVEMPEERWTQVRGGFRRPPRLTTPMLGDEIFEVDASGKQVWRVKLHEVLDPLRDRICALEGRVEWTHLNSLAVDADGNVLFSCRNTSTIGRLSSKTGELQWKLGAGEVFHQHHATWLPNGNVQIFDNGMHRRGYPRSRVVEIDPSTDAVVWQYTATPEVSFFSAHISSAERQPNGNVLVCEGAAGRVFEATPTGEVVWEWTSPFVHEVRGEMSAMLFRAHRYGQDHPALAGKALDPAAHAEANRLHHLGWRRGC